jgi:hypothetical protein
MTEAEQAFLAQLAIGVFSVDKSGAIWRHRRLVAGSRSGAPPYEVPLDEARSAETSESDGYPKVMFTVGEKRMAVFAHRIVWMTANQADIPAGMEVNHKDGDRANRAPSNLELVTPSGNVIHGIRVLGRKAKEQRGEKNNSAKLTAQKVREIRRMCAERTMAQTEIARVFGVSQRTISDIHLRLSWKDVPDSTG